MLILFLINGTRGSTRAKIAVRDRKLVSIRVEFVVSIKSIIAISTILKK